MANSFNRDTTSKITTPPVAQAPAFSQAGSTAGDIAKSAGFVAQVWQRGQAVKDQKSAIAAKAAEQERMSTRVLEIAKERKAMEVGGASSQEIDSFVTNAARKGMSSVQAIEVIKMTRSAEMGGNVSKSAQDRANAKADKAEQSKLDFDNANAQAAGFSEATEQNRPYVEVYLHQKKLDEQAEQEYKTAKRELEIDSANASKNARVLVTQVKAISTSLQTQAESALRVGISEIESNPEFDTPEKKQVAIQQLIDQGVPEIFNNLANNKHLLPSEVYSGVVNDMTNLVDRYNVYSKGISSLNNQDAKVRVMTRNMVGIKAKHEMNFLKSPLGPLLPFFKNQILDSSFIKTNAIDESTTVANQTLEHLGKLIGTTTPENGGDYQAISTSPQPELTNVLSNMQVQILKEIEAGDITATPEQNQAITESIKSNMTTAVNPTIKSKHKFSKSNVTLVNEGVLSPHYETLNTGDKAIITENIGEYSGSYFGAKGEGSFIPSIYKNLRELGIEEDKLGSMFEFGMNDATGGLTIAIIDPEVHASREAGKGIKFPFTNTPHKRDAAALLRFRDQVVNDATANNVIRSLAKASNISVKEATMFVLQEIHKTGKLKVNKNFLVKDEPKAAPKEEAKPAPVSRDVSDLSPEELIEFQQMERKAAGIPDDFAQVSDSTRAAFNNLSEEDQNTIVNMSGQEMRDLINNSDGPSVQDRKGQRDAEKAGGELFKDEEGTVWRKTSDGSFERA